MVKLGCFNKRRKNFFMACKSMQRGTVDITVSHIKMHA